MKKIASDRNYRLTKEAFNWPGSKKREVEKTRQKLQENAQKGGLQFPVQHDTVWAMIEGAQSDLTRLSRILKGQGFTNSKSSDAAIEKELDRLERRGLAIRRSLQRLGFKGNK